MALKQVRVVQDFRYADTTRADIRTEYGEGPWFRIELEYGAGEFDTMCFLGIEQLASLHSNIGAILGKRAHEAQAR